MTSPFTHLGLSSSLVETLTDAGYTTPTAIQESSIPPLLEGKDLLGCAQTGTGKTASFLLPIIDQLATGRKRARMPRAIILEPTRELATQVLDAFHLLSKRSSLSAGLIIGGESMAAQEKLLSRGVDVLISTPGRFIDLQKRGHFLLTSVQIFVLDEADRMLDMGFLPDIERIFAMLPPRKQTILLSATLSDEIKKLSQRFLTNPTLISISPSSSVASTITQNQIVFPFVKTTPMGKRLELKFDVLLTLLKKQKISRGIIFCNRKKDVDIVAKKLSSAGYTALALHGDLPQIKRTRTLKEFKEQKDSLLIASDVAARGLDIDDMPTVFSFDVPTQAEDYVHRIGRTGRAGKSGQSYLFTSQQDEKSLLAIEKLIKTNIPILSMDLADKTASSQKKRRAETSHHDHRTKMTPATTRESSSKRAQSAPAPRKEKASSSSSDLPPVVGFGEDLPDFMKACISSYRNSSEKSSSSSPARYGTVMKNSLEKDI